MNNLNDSPENAIAIIGMAGRFPGAKDMGGFWNNLRDGVESVRFFSRDELLKMGIDRHLLDNPRFVAADAILDGMDQFDAGFFDYSAREAEIMDPQHRLFLESAWEVLESAGYNSELYDGRIAVYAGANLSGYMIRNLYSNPGLVENVGTFKIMLANGQDFLATKVSYKMNLMGPSVNVNTLCSSSLVAVHYACQNLLNYGCDIALAGGVSFQVSRNEAFFYQEGGIGSSDGHCRAFDSKANGTVSGSGLAVVALKRLEDALEDGDHIHAVIRGTAINNDGASKNSYTAPNVDGQAQCIAEAIAVSGVDPETITYIDAHGTGTNLGDPIEIAALTKAFSAYTDKKQFCAVGSVKTNIGHLVNAGGLASVVKTVLAMENGMLPPSLNFEEPNPKIDFVNSPFYVNSKLAKWETGGTPLRAGVSSFGIGGTNTHVILEEAPEKKASGKSNRQWQLITLSAKTETALEKLSENLADYLEKNPGLEPADIAFTLQLGRRNFSHRRTFSCRSVEEIIDKLQSLPEDQVFSNFQKAKEKTVVFIFPGTSGFMDSERLHGTSESPETEQFHETEELPREAQFSETKSYLGAGRQYGNMSLELYRTEPLFKETVDMCAGLLEPRLSLDIREVLYGNAGRSDGANGREELLDNSALFVTQYALGKMLMEWGITPELMLGEGTGEYAAACLGGVFTLEAALELVSSPVQQLGEAAGKIRFQVPSVPLVSSVTGRTVSEEEAISPAYWEGIHNSGNFSRGLEDIMEIPGRLLLELGPGRSLYGGAERTDVEESGNIIIPVMPEVNAAQELSGEKCRGDFLLQALGKFWLYGGSINWNKFYAKEKRHRIPLPTYPFERQRYWIEPSTTSAGEGRQESASVLDRRPRPQLETPYGEPETPTEKIIADICKDILGYEQVGVNDDFFDLGGHSLLAVAFISRLRKALKKDISLECLFENTTVAKLGAIFDENSKGGGRAQEEFEEGVI